MTKNQSATELLAALDQLGDAEVSGRRRRKAVRVGLRRRGDYATGGDGDSWLPSSGPHSARPTRPVDALRTTSLRWLAD
ncbi:MAG TPA: hypothetical protein DD670_08025 [Planctomycetaceae bacterium]|nr:hypothetical protein [Planctomycetaceae bacterium]